MVTEINIKNQILDTARTQFFSYGFSKVTTDEIASELGISKKTLYKFFPRKDKLLQEVMELTMNEIKSGVERILDDSTLEFRKKLEKVLNFMGFQISRLFRKPFVVDLQKKTPQIWLQIEAFRKEMIHTKFASLIEEGVRKGVFRDDVNQQIVVLIYFGAIQNIINPETLSHLPFTANEAFDSIMKILFKGLLTEEARIKT